MTGQVGEVGEGLLALLQSQPTHTFKIPHPPHIAEVSIIVADFIISVYGSSCNSYFIGFFLLLFDSIPKAGWVAKEYKRNQKNEIEAEKDRCTLYMNCRTQKWSNPGLLDSPLVNVLFIQVNSLNWPG